jgi:hypothetical protein
VRRRKGAHTSSGSGRNVYTFPVQLVPGNICLLWSYNFMDIAPSGENLCLFTEFVFANSSTLPDIAFPVTTVQVLSVFVLLVFVNLVLVIFSKCQSYNGNK